MDQSRDEVTSWLHEVVRRTGETPSSLARKAGLATTTITRFLNEPGSPMLSLRSLAKIAHAAGVASVHLPGPASGGTGASGLSDGDGEPYRCDEQDPLARAVTALVAGRNGADPWRLNTRALDAIGYLCDDVVIVDLNQRPVAGDAVCAQFYNWDRGRAETIFRVYEPPYLVAATLAPDLAVTLRKPLLVDNDRVIIKGVITDVLRHRRAA